ncbi:N-formylglutamate amidohydrolase [soil metagenome]
MGGRDPTAVDPAYCQYGEPGQAGALLITVPHAGREYPADLLARARVGLAGLQSLEDRHVDALAAEAVAAGHCALIARRGRAIIDLNRHEGEMDGASVAALPHGLPLRASAKLRGGLGVVPHRYHSLGDLWLRRPPYAEVAERIRTIHRPWHARLAELLAAIRASHGAAILLDLHSMPSIRGDDVDVVLCDRFGQSASRAISASAAALIESHGFRVAVNAPYAGGYVLERHGRPQEGVHALQLEIYRTLYLDATLDAPGPGVERCRRMVADLAQMLGSAFEEPIPLAAE